MSYRAIFVAPLLYQQLFYCPQPPAVAPEPVNNFMASTTMVVPMRKTLFYQAKIAPPPRPPDVPPPIDAVASTTTSQVVRRTLFYQSRIEPIVVPTADNTVTIDKWQQPFVKAIPRRPTPPTEYALYVEIPPIQFTSGWYAPLSVTVRPVQRPPTEWVTYVEQPPPTAPAGWYAPLNTVPVRELLPRADQIGYFQPPTAEDNNQTIDKWQQPLSKAVPRPPVFSALYTPFVPKEATLDNTISGEGWGLTTDGRQGPPRQLFSLPGGSPFVPKEAVLENTVTPDKWLLPFSKAVPEPRLNISDIIYAQTAPTADNTVTVDKWKIDWVGAKPTKPTHTQPALTPIPSNLTTTLEWLASWRGQGPPRELLGLASGEPFIPKEATLENTVTPDNWLQPFYKAAPRSPVTHTQPFFGYPYVAASNLTTTLEWQLDWRGPPRVLQRYVSGSPFVPKEATLENTQTPDKWLQSFRGPPRYWPIKVQTPPFVPREAVLDNTVTPDNWLQRWQGPPRYWPIKVQAIPFVPREATSENTVTVEKWHIRWRDPPRRLLGLPGGQPFVAKEATIENTIGSLSWIQAFNKAVPATRPTNTQPFYGYPYEFASNLTTTLEWLQAFRGPPRYKPVHTNTFWNYQPVLVDNTVTIEKWQQPFGRAVRVRSVTYAPAVFAYPICIPAFEGGAFQFDAFQTCADADFFPDNTITGIAWYRNLDRPVDKRPVDRPHISWRFPEPPPPPVFVGTSVIANFVRTRTLFYQSRVYVPMEPPPPDTGIERLPSVVANFVRARTLFYQSLTAPVRRGEVTYTQNISTEIELTVNLHVCGFGTEDQQGDSSSEESQEGDAWVVQAEQTDAAVDQSQQADASDEQEQGDDDFDEQEECGR